MRKSIRLAGIVVMTMPVLACTASSTQLERIDTQLGEIQIQVQQLRKIAATAEHLEAIGTTLDEGQSAVAAIGADVRLHLDALAQQIERLEAKVEGTHFRLSQLADQIDATNREIEVFRAMVEAEHATPVPPAVISTPEPDPTDPQALYDRAYADFQRGSYDLAIRAFQRYVEKFTDTEHTDNATYWIGESFYRQQQFEGAVRQFDEVITRFPESDRVPSALLKKGYANLELGNRDAGIRQLQEVIRAYAGSDEAQLARQRLDALGIDENG